MTPRPALGLIVLRVDETIEDEFRTLIPPEAAKLHITRIDSGDDLTPETIGTMEQTLTASAALLPAAAEFDVVGYACTSGAAFLGAENVTRRVQAGVPTRHVTNPLSAAVAELARLGIARIGLVSPYMPPVADQLSAAFAAQGIEVAASVSLEEQEEARVARIPAEQIATAARGIAQHPGTDAIFLSCTNLRTVPLLDPLTEELGRPVLSSNAALARQMQHLAAG